jgi:NAD-dependent DNA ligase
MTSNIAAAKAAATHKLTRAIEHLNGLVSGMLADGVLQDLEIHYLNTWLAENADVATNWPGSAIAQAVRHVLADRKIEPTEREHLVDILKRLSSNDFSDTGAVSDEATTLPINDAVTLTLPNQSVCHTGEFLFGTRAAVERASLKAGAMAVDRVTSRTDILVIGTRVSPSWRHTSYGAKIERACELQEKGHSIEIVSERRWLQAIG